MIEFLRSTDNQAIWIKVTAGGPITEPLWWRHECLSALECQLLQDYLKRAMATQLEEIRRVSYERGWKDAKSKKGKSTTFATCMTVLGWERQ